MKSDLQNNSILIVDDQTEILDFLLDLLSEAGFKVSTSQSGEEALNLIKVSKPDLILLDINLPDFDGYEICKKIKTEEITKDIPVLFLSGRDETEDIVRGFEVGGSDYIKKPFENQEVLARVKTHLQMKYLHENLENKTCELLSVNQNLQSEIIERKKAVEALQKSQILLNETGQMAKVGGWEYIIETQRLIWTEEVYHIYEVELSYDPTPNLLLDFYTNPSKEIVSKAFQQAIEFGIPFDIELELTTANGNFQIVHAIGKANYIENKVNRLSGTFQDITERKRSENALIETRLFNDLLIHTANILIIGLDLKGNLTLFNPMAEKTTGYSFKELKEKNWFETLVTKNDYSSVWEKYEKLSTGDYPKILEYSIVTKSGEEKIISWSNSEIISFDKFFGIISFGIDITKSKQVEKELRNSEYRYRVLFEQAAVGVAQVDPISGQFQKVNKKYSEITGYNSTEILSLTIRKMNLPEDLEIQSNNITRLLKGEIKSYSAEKRLICKDKHIIWVNLTVSYVKENHNIPGYLIGIIEDISSRKEIENILEMRNTELKIANEQLSEEIEIRKRKEDNLIKSKIILDSISGGVLTIDENENITTFNKAAQEITGFSMMESINAKLTDILLLSEQNIIIKDYLQKRIEIDDKSVQLIRKNGKSIPITLSATILKGNSEFEKEYAMIFRDMSQVDILQKELKKEFTTFGIISQSPNMKKIFSILPAVANSNSSVLIEGPTGTGKELLARAIHNLSPRKDKPYIIINCGGIPSNLIESELFGHVKGAFTDAKYDREGKISTAEGGTIFFDEIAELPFDMQSKLLRLLENYEIQKVGLDKSLKVDIRVIAATNKDLKISIIDGKFREDLYHRLNTVKFSLPALKERREDIPFLIEHFINKNNAKFNKNIANITTGAMKAIINYSFPGNIRELERAIEYAFIICDKPLIDIEHLPEDILIERRDVIKSSEDYGDPSDLSGVGKNRSFDRKNIESINQLTKPLEILSEEEEKELIIATLKKFKGNKTKTSKSLQIHYTTLWKKLKKYNIPL